MSSSRSSFKSNSQMNIIQNQRLKHNNTQISVLKKPINRTSGITSPQIMESPYQDLDPSQTHQSSQNFSKNIIIKEQKTKTSFASQQNLNLKGMNYQLSALHNKKKLQLKSNVFLGGATKLNEDITSSRMGSNMQS